MPEGDTVWRTARSLDRALSGQELVTTDFRVPEIATVDLSGRVVESTVARGKHLLTRIGDDHTLHTHLRMEGSWHLYRPGSRWRRPTHQARVVLTTEEWTAVGFSLGVTELVPRADEGGLVAHLGPDLLGPDWDEEEALTRLRSQPERPLVEALLDQRNLAGIGNMYAAELCFLAGLRPHVPVADADGLPRIVRRAKALLESNKERAQQATTGDLRRGRTHWVYARAGERCRRCGTRVERGTHGVPPRDRVTFWCPTCQRP